MLDKASNKMGTLKVEEVGPVQDVYAKGHPKAGQPILDNNGNPNAFRKVVFSVASEFDAQGREIITTARPRSRNIWRNTNPDLFSKLRTGMYVSGRIVTEECASYELNGRLVNTISFIQFADETVAQAMNNTGRARASVRNTRESAYDSDSIAPGQYPEGTHTPATATSGHLQEAMSHQGAGALSKERVSSSTGSPNKAADYKGEGGDFDEELGGKKGK